MRGEHGLLSRYSGDVSLETLIKNMSNRLGNEVSCKLWKIGIQICQLQVWITTEEMTETNGFFGKAVRDGKGLEFKLEH